MRKNILFLSMLLMACTGNVNKTNATEITTEDSVVPDNVVREEQQVRLPDDAVKKDENERAALYVCVDGVGSENGQWSVWHVEKKSGRVVELFHTNNSAEAKWSQMADGNGIQVSKRDIAAGNCEKCMLLPWDANKVYVEGCPDGRNVWSYVYDIKKQTAIQFPSTEGLISVDAAKKQFHMRSYRYHIEDGRYSVEQVFTADGKLIEEKKINDEE